MSRWAAASLCLCMCKCAVFCAAADEPWKRSNAYVMSFSGDWKDLSAKFVLQVWRDYCLTHNRLFLDDLYELCRVFMRISSYKSTLHVQYCVSTL